MERKDRYICIYKVISKIHSTEKYSDLVVPKKKKKNDFLSGEQG